MKNLAGNREADTFIRAELEACGIEVISTGTEQRGEVPASFVGKIGPFTFRRCWYYWSVDGPMPLTAANEMYHHPDGRHDVRVAGHCGCPPPSEWIRSPREEFVDEYHIDTQTGLDLFAATIRKYSLHKAPT